MIVNGETTKEYSNIATDQALICFHCLNIKSKLKIFRTPLNRLLESNLILLRILKNTERYLDILQGCLEPYIYTNNSLYSG